MIMMLMFLGILVIWFFILLVCTMILAITGTLLDQIRERRLKNKIYNSLKEQIKKDYDK